MAATSYKIIGEEGVLSRSYRIPWTLLVLNRSRSIFQADSLAAFSDAGFTEIISIENSSSRQRSYSQIVRQIKGVRFIVTDTAICTGEQINIGIAASRCPFVAVIWNDMQFRTLFTDSFIHEVEHSGSLCTVPLLHSNLDDLIPSVLVPVMNKKTVKTIPMAAIKTGTSALFPFDYTGVYSKKLFQLVGGYDTEIKSSYWQKMDFGFRSWLWGEKILLNSSFRLYYTSDFQQDDTSIDHGYRRFYLKNLAVHVRDNLAYLPKLQLFSYILRSGEGLMLSLADFKEASAWVRANRTRYIRNGQTLISDWQKE